MAQRKNLIKTVFNPRKGEKVLLLTDRFHEGMLDRNLVTDAMMAKWKARNVLVADWCNTLADMGEEIGFSFKVMVYDATGRNNAPIPREALNAAAGANLVLAMTQYSPTAPLKPLVDRMRRVATMPGVTRDMEDTAMSADYALVSKYAKAIEKMLNDAYSALVQFSTGDTLEIDLRNRAAEADTGECTENGQFINFPAGEAFKTPYEAEEKEEQDEKAEFGISLTNGIMPVSWEAGGLFRFVIEQNRIVDAVLAEGGPEAEAERKRLLSLFAEDPGRANIAELGIGCNQKARPNVDEVLEKEKAGLHIAYGKSEHLGGKVDTDMHIDVVYAKGCAVEGTLTLHTPSGSIKLIENSQIQYGLLH